MADKRLLSYWREVCGLLELDGYSTDDVTVGDVRDGYRKGRPAYQEAISLERVIDASGDG